MRTALFTKLFGDRPVAEVAQTTARLGFDGTDLLVRDGYTVPTGRAGELPGIVRAFADAGAPVLMVTTDLTDPAAYPAEQVLAGCAASGVRLVRLGYWPYLPEQGYAKLADAARRDLDSLETLARRHGCTLLIQLHGETIHSSGAMTLRLLADRDPELIGAYPDPGNQAVQDGREEWRLTLDLLAPWLRCVGVKNGGWFAAQAAATGQRRWWSDWLALNEGMVPWDEIIPALTAMGYDGILSLHSHYELPYQQVLDVTGTDRRYVAGLLRSAAA